jgi:hypothetical protein
MFLPKGKTMNKKKPIKTKEVSSDLLNRAFEVAEQFGWKLSILIDNPLPDHIGKGKESYVGKIFGIDKDFVVLDLIHNPRLSKIIIRKSLILSVWIYRE